MSRRRFLLSCLVAGGLAFNAFYFLKIYLDSGNPDQDEIDAVYVAYMPELEAKQRENPNHFLSAGMHIARDPEYPELSLRVAGEKWSPYSRLGADAYRCGITGLSVRKYVYGMDETDVAEMPDRMFLAETNSAAIECLRHELPAGFVLSRLANPVKPSEVGWDVGELQLYESNQPS